jgi:serine phosphatase RsbU (regulator of sigma subunit)
MLNEGVRDGAAARAAHDFLYAQRGGRVSAALDIVSIDLQARTVLFTRNSEVPMLIVRDGEAEIVSDSGGRIGIYPYTRPRVIQFPMEAGMAAVLVTDGVANAGTRAGAPADLLSLADDLDVRGTPCQDVTDILLERAMAKDQGRPQDDMTVVVLKLGPGTTRQPIRRLSLSLPLPL